MSLMKKLAFFSTFLFLFLGFLFLKKIGAIDIEINTTGWSETIDASDLSSGPGSDLTGAYESASDATVIKVKTSGKEKKAGADWRIDVKRTDSTWHGDFTLYVRRTSDGTGSGTISGGDSYIAVQTADSQFFSGSDDREDVDVQYKLTGMSISVSPQTYSTTITYTVIEVP